MNIWQNAVITNKGLALLAKLVSGTTLTITKAMTGSGYVTPGLLPQQTGVTSPQQTLLFRSITYQETGQVCVPAYLTNDDLETGYTATQVGFYAQDPDEGEILYFIAQATSGTGIVVPSETEMPGYNAEWDFYFAYGQADEVSVTVDPSNTINANEAQQMIDDAIDAISPAWTAADTVNTYKRIYIDPDGSDDNAGTSTAPMATIIAALRKYAQTCSWLDIYMNDGTYTQEIGTLAFDTCDVAIRSTSQNKDNVTINIANMIDVMVGSVRLYNLTINMTTANTRPISVDNGRLYCYAIRVNVDTTSTASCVNVYNGSMAWLYNCVLNSGTEANAGACAYGNQAMLIKALNCTTERTVTNGFYAINGATIEYTETVTANTMTKESSLGRCYVPSKYLPITGGILTGNLTIDPSISSPPALVLTAEGSGNTTASTRMSKNANAGSDLGTYIRDYSAGGVDSNNYTQLQIRRGSPSLAGRLQLVDVVNGTATAYSIYGDFNKQVVDATTEADS